MMRIACHGIDMDQTDTKPRLFQGFKALHLKNWASVPVVPDSIDAVILTAPLDHRGYLPLLIKRGCRGAVYCLRAGSLSRTGLHLPRMHHLSRSLSGHHRHHSHPHLGREEFVSGLLLIL